MNAEILFKNAAREKMKKGVDLLADSVKVTLGAKGRNVTIRNQRTGKPRVTKDGVTVARTIDLPDKFEDMGAQLVKDAAEKTAAQAGDGTTTSTLLAQTIIHEGMKALEANGNPIGIKRGIDMAVDAVVKSLKSLTKIVTLESEYLVEIATISANNDRDMGMVVAEALKKVGNDGVVTIQKSRTAETYIEIVDGLQIDKGYITPYFVNNFTKMTVDYEDALILLCERKISTFSDLENVLNFAILNKKPLLIIAEDVDGEALATLIANRTQKGLLFAAIKLPGFGNMSQQMLEDIAVITGGKVVSEQKGDVIRSIKIGDYIGRAQKVTISNVTTNIVGGKGKKSEIQAHIDQVRALIANTQNPYEKDKLTKQRLAKLVNGVGVIFVGATTEVEMEEKKDRIDDAVCATQAAIEEGVLPGGGVAYIRAIADVEALQTSDEDEKKGIEIIRQALDAPLRQMLENAGETPITVIANVTSGKEDYGYNVKTGAYENFFETGIIDPAKVARVAIENAASVGAMFLTTEVAIVDIQLPQQK